MRATERQAAKRTFMQVACVAQVSPATVSRVMAGAAGVSKDVADRVRQAAQALGVDIEKKRTKIIAFSLSNRDVLHAFQARILCGAEAYCAQQGWEMLYLTFRYPLEAACSIHIPQILTRRDIVRGVILGGTNSANLLHSLRKLDIPFAVLGNNVFGEWNKEDFDVVSSDDTNGAFELTSNLIAEGHRCIWYFGDMQLPWHARCAEGYGRAMAAAGLQPRIKEVHAADYELGYLAAKSLVTDTSVTAVFAGSDQIAVGVYRAFREAGLSIPDDVSVAGFNDTEGAILYPRLSSVREFPEELGRHLAELVLRRIAAPNGESTQVVLPTQVLWRESCRPAEQGRQKLPRASMTVADGLAPIGTGSV